MNNGVRGFGAVVSMYLCIFGEIVFSGALKNLFVISGGTAVLCVAVASVLVVLLSFWFKNLTAGYVTALLSGIYLFLVIFRLCESMVLFQSAGFMALVLVGLAVLCLLSFAYKIKGAAIFTAFCFVPIALIFALCCLLGIGEYDYSNLNITVVAADFILGTLVAFSLMFPLLLPLPYADKDYKPTAQYALWGCCAAIILTTILGTMAFGITATDYQSVIGEISKNVSVGKFFQRLEGPADAIYILSAVSVAVLLSAMISGVGESKPSLKSKIIFAVIIAVEAALSFLAVRYSLLYSFAQAVTVLFGFGVLLFVPKLFKFKKLIIPIVFCLCLCSCSTPQIENSVYAVAVAYDSRLDSVCFITEGGMGQSFYSVPAENFLQAQKEIERNRSIKLSLKQTGLVLLNKDCDKVEDCISQVLTSVIPNSALLCFYEGDIGGIYQSVTDNYQSAFDFVSALKSKVGQGDRVCNTVSRANLLLKTDSAEPIAALIDGDGYKGYVSKIGEKLIVKDGNR